MCYIVYIKGVILVLFEPKKELKVSNYLPTYQVMLQATKWIDPCTGDEVKLSAGLKLYYEYRLQRFNYFDSIGAVYSETNESCGNALGIGVTSISNKYNALLKRMGLLEVIKLTGGDKEHSYSFIVYKVTSIKGWLINPHFSNISKEQRKFNGDKIDYQQLKTLEANKRLADSIRYNKDSKVYLMSEQERREYLELKKELKSFE